MQSNANFVPVSKTTLSDRLAQKIVQFIQAESFDPGDRLPSIMDMARSFGVGHPTLREALKTLETIGAVEIRHGSGVYVGKNHNVLLVSNPVFGAPVSRKLLLDLIEARIPIETKTAMLAAQNASDEEIEKMAAYLREAGTHIENDAQLSSANMAFHRQIAYASGNVVLAQLLDVLTNLFHNEQNAILKVYGSRRKDHKEHLGILEAIRDRNPPLAEDRIKAHLEGVREVLLRSDQDLLPV